MKSIGTKVLHLKKAVFFISLFTLLNSVFAEFSGPTREDIALGFSIKQNLEHYHFNRDRRDIDDKFSKDAFDLYLKSVDRQKRLFIKEDISLFMKYQDKIDDDLKGGRYELITKITERLESNAVVIKESINKMLEKGFDFDKEETFETDPEKLDYCDNLDALKDRWRKLLKHECIIRFINLDDTQKTKIDIENKIKEKKAKEEKETKEKVSKAVEDKDKKAKKPFKPKTMTELRNEAREKVKKNFNIFFKRLAEMKHKNHFSRFLNAVTATYDPHTNYMDPKAKEDFDIQMKKSLEGIGAVLQEENDFTKVVRIVPGSASYRQGELESEDLILRVSQGDTGEEVDITGMSIREVVGYIRGPKGTKVNLTVKKPNNEIKVISIIRDIVKLEGSAVARSTTIKRGKENYGYVYLPDFYRDFSNKTNKNCTSDVIIEIQKLKNEKINGLVFDLRNNGGGALEDARQIAGLFIKSGPIVQVKNSAGRIRVLHDRDNNILYDGPLVIMVNQFSASASEILAAALQDYKRAVIIGSGQTHGKGTVQQILELKSLPQWGFKFGSLKLTIQKFYRINGGSTQNRGVIPDIDLPYQRSFLESGERFLDHSLVWDSIPAQRYRVEEQKVNGLETLAINSKKRIEKSSFFAEIEKRHKDLKKQYDNTQIVLSHAAIEKERHEREKAEKDFEKILKSIKKVDDKEESKKVDKKKLTEEESKKLELEKWIKGIRTDPYVLEAVNILEDLISVR
jgi:carboxyl-terminal processing protease